MWISVRSLLAAPATSKSLPRASCARHMEHIQVKHTVSLPGGPNSAAEPGATPAPGEKPSGPGARVPVRGAAQPAGGAAVRARARPEIGDFFSLLAPRGGGRPSPRPTGRAATRQEGPRRGIIRYIPSAYLEASRRMRWEALCWGSLWPRGRARPGSSGATGRLGHPRTGGAIGTARTPFGDWRNTNWASPHRRRNNRRGDGTIFFRNRRILLYSWLRRCAILRRVVSGGATHRLLATGHPELPV